MHLPRPSKHLDQWGMGVSILCAIHCTIIPLAMSVLPLTGLGFLHNPLLEIMIIACSLILAILSLGFSYRRHRNKLPMVMVGCGFLLIFIGHFLSVDFWGWVLIPMGGLIIAWAHRQNWKLMKG